MAPSSGKFDENYVLPTVERQSYLFKTKKFVQILAPPEEDKPRKIISLVLFINN